MREEELSRMMPTNYDRRARTAGSPPEPAEDPRPFADISSDLMRVAGSGISSPLLRARTESTVRSLAEEAYAAGRAAALTPAEVAAWLERQPVRLPPDARDARAVSHVIELLRGRS